ncbi:MAG TPA: precorrin-4 C(11)-methyltransferase, partial [Beijerinckiaceae bacterium]|nr:precorrin-4 C(11)-methyltransferase [Beijerinckiaceae bacterium]
PLVQAAGLERTALILVGRALGATGFFGESALYSAGYDRRFRPSARERDA